MKKKTNQFNRGVKMIVNEFISFRFSFSVYCWKSEIVTRFIFVSYIYSISENCLKNKMNNKKKTCTNGLSVNGIMNFTLAAV